MLLLLVGLTFLSITFASFALCFQINGINRVVVGTPISIFESCIEYNPDSDSPDLLFTKSLVKQKLQSYYDTSLQRFTDKYEYDIYFYHLSDESYCTEERCGAVEVNFKAKLSFNYNYKRQLIYTIMDTKYGS